MKNNFLRLVVSCMVCFFLLKASTMELNIKGSASEIEKQLYGIFPIGISKQQVLSVAADKLRQNSEAIKRHDYGERPLILKIDSKDLHVYSWVELELGEYRSIKHFFIKTTAITKLYFDKNEKLIGLDVKLYGDSL